MTLVALYHVRHTHFLLGALARLHEVDDDAAVDITATAGGIGAGSSTASAAAKSAEAAENAVENIAHIAKAAAEAACTGTAAIAGIHAGMPELVIPCTLLLIREDTVSLVDLLEFFCCFLIVRMQIGVILPCHCLKGLFDLLFRSTLLQPQHFIIIPFFRHVCRLLSLNHTTMRDKPKPAP